MFHGYPKFVVDFQIAERSRLAAEEEEVRRKRRLLEALSERARGLANEEEAWQKQQESLIQAEETRRRTAEDGEVSERSAKHRAHPSSTGGTNLLNYFCFALRS